VVEQTTQTNIQEQCKITMVEFQKAERQRGIADRAYRESLGLTPPEFVDLRRIEAQNEIAQHSPTALTAIYKPRTHRLNMLPMGAEKKTSGCSDVSGVAPYLNYGQLA
jgi:hypothetical protein